MRLGAGTGRVENHGIEFFQLVGHQWFAHQVAHFSFQWLEAARQPHGLSQAGDRRPVAIEGGDLGFFCDPQGEGADPAEEIGYGLGFGEGSQNQICQDILSGLGGLEE